MCYCTQRKTTMTAKPLEPTAPSTPCCTVRAAWMDTIQFAYKCPFCSHHHYHGSEGQFHSRVEERNTHCLKNRKVMRIIIDETTPRQYK